MIFSAKVAEGDPIGICKRLLMWQCMCGCVCVIMQCTTSSWWHYWNGNRWLCLMGLMARHYIYEGARAWDHCRCVTCDIVRIVCRRPHAVVRSVDISWFAVRLQIGYQRHHNNQNHKELAQRKKKKETKAYKNLVNRQVTHQFTL